MTASAPITREEIEFIRPRIVHPDGWYYQDKPADEIANNAIDDIEVCLARIDELEAGLIKIRTASGVVPKDWNRCDLLELIDRIFDHAHAALGSDIES